MELHEADYYRKLADGTVLCQLCPHSCRIKDGKRGRCRVRENRKGKLYSMVYGKPSALAIDPVEKKPLFHFLPGSPVFSIGTAGCNQCCVFCLNWRFTQYSPEEVGTLELSPELAVKTALGENPGKPFVENWFFTSGGPKVEMGPNGIRCPLIAYTYNEPTIFTEYMLDVAKLAQKQGIRNMMHSCGLVNPKPLQDILGVLDSVNIDLKYFSEEAYRKYSCGHLKPVLNTIKTVHKSGKWMEITTLVIPGLNDNENMLREEFDWLYKNIGPNHPLHISRFFPNYKLLDTPATDLAKLEQVYKIAKDVGLNYVYIGNVPGHEAESTFCPNCGKRVIERTGYVIKRMELEQGACKKCGYKIAGVWK